MTTLSWLLYFGALGLLSLATRNPIYLALLLAVAHAVGRSFERTSVAFKPLSPMLAVLVLAVSAGYSALFFHAGDTVLLRLPDWPLIGGPLTLEAAIHGALSGLTLLTLLMVVRAFVAIIPAAALVRLAPAGLQELGLAVLIAINYLPQTGRQLEQIREAQAIRGHRLHGVRDWRPMLIPLLVGGLERSTTLAEAMVARGYGSAVSSGRGPWLRLALIGGLLAAMWGWLVAAQGERWGAVLLAAALALLFGALVLAGRGRRRSAYQGQRLTPLTMLLWLATLQLALVWLGLGGDPLAYSPFPKLMAPPFQVVLGLSILALALLPRLGALTIVRGRTWAQPNDQL
ncbi:MAG: energy-coupling factor transporter transmembrane component T [Candidatus Promineifilaceae bacterium]